MEEGSSSASSPPSDSNPTATSNFLVNLPSRGLFSSTVSSSNLVVGKRSDGNISSCVIVLKHPHPQNSKLLPRRRAAVICERCGNRKSPEFKYIVFRTRLLVIMQLIIHNSRGGMRVYVCDHDTAPPENQVIKTDQMNILIRSLTLKKQKGDVADGSRKRASDKAADGRASAKRAMTSSQNGAQQVGSSSRAVDKDFQGLTVERLRALLKEKGLSVKGKKDELIGRLRSASK